MEFLIKHITQEQIQDFLSRDTDTIWLTLSDETCICYGEGTFNNPTNLPTYHTHDKGGIIVCFNDDISFGVVSSIDSNVGKRFMLNLQQYLGRRGKVIITGNDLLYNGKKVASYSILNKDGKYISTFHISVDMNNGLVKAICTKPVWKVPGGLKHFGFTRQELLDKTLEFLELEESKPKTPKAKENSPIDICVMWVNPERPKWQEEYNTYKQLEISRGSQNPKNPAAFSNARYRDWGIFNYWFRGVEKACPWVHKVFLVLEDEDQVPEWLNVNNPKLRIVYHREFVPNDCLPQFNGPAIEMWYSNIPDLSENFIACDDDYYFYNPIPSDWFFENDVPQTEINTSGLDYSIFKNSGATWYCMMANDNEFVSNYVNRKCHYTKSHLPEARNKSFEKKIIEENYEVFHNALSYSHFRSPKSYTAWLFIDLMKALGVSHNKPVYNGSKVVPLASGEATEKAVENMTYKMVCFNDVGGNGSSDDFPCRAQLKRVFATHFPHKSSFEV